MADESLGAKAPAVSTTGVIDSGGIEPFGSDTVVAGCSFDALFDLVGEPRFTR